MATTHPGGSRLAWQAVAGGFANFLLLGAVQALYGPSLPSIRETFSIDAPTAAVLVSAHFAGVLVGVLGCGVLAPRTPTGVRLSVGSLMVTAGTGTIGTAMVWPAVLGGAVLLGLGAGVMIESYNVLFSTGFGPRSPALLALVNAAYQAGSTIGAVAAGAIPGSGFRAPFLVAGGIAAALTAVVLAVPDQRVGPIAALAGTGPPPRWGLLAGFALMLFVASGIEVDAGGWEPTQLVSRGFSKAAAANLTALFWLGETAGRVLLAAISLRVGAPKIVVASATALLGCCLLARLAPLAPVAYIGVGIFVGPIFPMVLVWFGQVAPGMRMGSPLLIAGALIGSVTVPLAVGQMIAASGPDVLPTALSALAFAGISMAVVVSRFAGAPASGTAAIRPAG